MREPVAFDPKSGYPAGRSIVYECGRCGVTIPSAPGHDEPYRCACGNVAVDPDAGRVSVKDHAQLTIWRVAP
jgi:hypothetical protein